MAKTISIQYRRASDGTMQTATVTLDFDKMRYQTEEGTLESFFLKASVAGNSAVTAILENIDDIVADALDGKPSSHKRGIVQTKVSAAFTANGTTLTVTPAANTAGFVANVPCVVLSKYGTVIGWFIPTVVGATFTIPAANEGALAYDASVGWIVQQAEAFATPLAENSEWGIRAQLEKLAVPTVVTASKNAPGSFKVAWTKPTDDDLGYFDIYVIKTSVAPNSIEANSLPTVEDRLYSLVSSNVVVSQYFDESTMTLKNIVYGTYFIGVLAKNTSGRWETRDSHIAWSSAITYTSTTTTSSSTSTSSTTSSSTSSSTTTTTA